MELKTIDQIKILAGKRVLLRLDLNVPFDDGQVDKEGDRRLERSLPTIKYLLQKKAKIIIVAHLGRPQGKEVPALSMLAVSEYLSKMLKKPIEFWADDFRDYTDDSFKMDNGSIAMIENIRFEPGEKKNSKKLECMVAVEIQVFCILVFIIHPIR